MADYITDTNTGITYYLFKNCIPISIILNLKEDYDDIVYTILRTDEIDSKFETIKFICYRYNNHDYHNVRCGFHLFYINQY